MQVLAESQALRTTLAVREQWNKFVLEPARALAGVAPAGRRIVIVIDALDEAGDSARDIMLEVFAELHQLPPIFRVFVTSRPDDDICAALRGRLFATSRNMEDIREESTRRDIQLYIHHQLRSIDSPTTEKLLIKADGHFQWIATACRFIKNGKEIQGYEWVGGDLMDRLNLVVESSTAYELDGLYTTILQDRFQAHVQLEAFLIRFRLVLGRVLHVQQPLTLLALTELRGDQEKENTTANLLKLLGSLLQGVSGNPDIPVQPLHASFRDYLMTAERSTKFCVTINHEHDHSNHLAMACLKVMKSLSFNMCKLKSSYLQNDQVLDLEMRIKSCIPEVLQYACRSWSHHISTTAQRTSALLQSLRYIIEEKILFWLEVLSALKEVNLASVQLLQLQRWTKVKNQVL